MDKKDPYYCSLLHKGLYLEKISPDEFLISSCCSMVRGPSTDKVDFVNNEFLKEKRILSRSEQIPECKQCWDLEKSKGWSHRTESNRWLAGLDDDIDPYSTELLRFDYNVDILCNAKCIQCSSWFSSLWAAEDQMYGNARPFRTYNNIRKNTFDSVDVSKLRHVYFNGGEPLLSTQPEEFLLKIQAQQDLGNLTVLFSTNGSTMPNQRLTDLLKKCKKTNLVVSLDGTGRAFEYIRNPLIWDDVKSNCIKMTELSDNIVVSFSNNIGIHNIDEVINIQEWYDDISDSVPFPSMAFNLTVKNLSLDNASKSLLDVWREKFTRLQGRYRIADDIINMINNAAGRTDDAVWLDYLNMIDQRRNLSWRQSLPNLYTSYKKISGN